ncbi:hypothetical protein B0J17DRAFT_665570 [Rhizoctonia solani]|nr:hypothetical protein B0J17DRAFT_665570 [Rhizoctonia solani]
MIRIPRQAPALYGSVALMAFAAVAAPSAAPSHSPSPVRTGYKAPGLPTHTKTYSAKIGKKARRDVSHSTSGRYISQGPFALKGWSAHGVAGSVSCIDILERVSSSQRVDE